MASTRKFKSGENVTLIDLQNKPHWNGRQAVVIRFDHKSRRYVVRLKDNYSSLDPFSRTPFAKLKSKNLRLTMDSSTASSRGFTFHSSNDYNHTDYFEAIRLNNEGLRYQQQKQYEKSWDSLHSALELKQRIFPKNDTRIAITTLLLADTYLGMKQFVSALEYCMETIRIRDECNDHELMYAVKCLRDILSAMKRICALCQWKCHRVCSSCRCHWYCSRRHQKIHWNSNHRVCCNDKLYREHSKYSRP